MPHPPLTAVLDRWSSFHRQLFERFTALMTEAEQGCATLLSQQDDDPAVMANAWTAMQGRASDLGMRLEDTFTDQVEPYLDELDVDEDTCDRLRAELDALQDRMEIELEATRLRVFAGAARTLWARALKQASPQLSCSQCAAPVAAPATLCSVNVSCPHCGSLVTYEPGARVRMLEHVAVHPLAEEQAWPQWLEMRRAEQRLHASREETLPLLQAYERAQLAYWHTYLRAKAALLPRVAADFDRDLRGKMQQWYEHIEHSATWARAGRPRALR